MDGEKFQGRRILVVEDDFSSRLYLNKILEKSGMEILNAADGKEAYEIILNDKKIDLVFMDIQLPVIDGYTCTKMLREAGVKTIIIAQTAYGLTGDKERLMSSGFDDYLIKPISQHQLFSKIYDFLK